MMDFLNEPMLRLAAAMGMLMLPWTMPYIRSFR
jgi:hypothetical protein